MMKSNKAILLVALAAGVCGSATSFVVSGPDFLYRTEPGQRVLQGVMSASAPPVPKGVRVATRGEPIPTLQLPDLTGRIVSIPTEFSGRPLLINFWASWCGPCIEEMPELQRFSAQQNSGVRVIGVALDDHDSVTAFLARVPVTYPVLLDTPGPADSSVRLGNPKGVLPYSVLVSADGTLLKQRIGPFYPGEIQSWVGGRPYVP